MFFTWESVVDWSVRPTVFSVGLSLLIIGTVLGLLEWRFRSPGRIPGRRSLVVDLIFWFFTPLVTKLVTTVVISTLLAWLFVSRIRSGEGDGGPSWVSRQPFWVQLAIVVLLGDFMHYWIHRLFHGDLLWPAHAVHHSPTELDWFSSMRMHPINDLTTRIFQGLPLYLLGFSLDAVAMYVPLVLLFVLFSHTNLPWTFGPFRYVLVSPVYHQWHHSSQPEAIDKNFAGMFPIWDLMFGTYYMPAGERPVRFGLKSDQPAESFVALMVYPLRMWARMIRRRFARPAEPPAPHRRAGQSILAGGKLRNRIRLRRRARDVQRLAETIGGPDGPVRR